VNLEKAKSRIAKKVRMGLQGYPILTITYSGATSHLATEVSVSFELEAGAAPQVETFSTKGDAREDESLQSALVKMIERSGAKTVYQRVLVAGPGAE
jgi:hypothetical protein